METAKKDFDKFLKSHEDTTLSKLTVDTVEPCHATSELFGRFGSFLFYKVKNVKKENSAMPYLSQIKQFFEKKWENDLSWSLHAARNNGQWYSVLRERLKNYILKNISLKERQW